MIVHASAPTSLFEFGAWTDTALTAHGAMLGGAAGYYAHVALTPLAGGGLSLSEPPGDYPGFAAFFRAAARAFCLDGLHADITTDLPAATAANMTAAGAVALVGGLACLAERRLAPLQIAAVAHRVLHEDVGYPCGVQPFVTAARGGVACYEISPFPRALPMSLPLSAEVSAELERRVLLVATGHPVRHGDYACIEERCQSAGLDVDSIVWRLRALPWQAEESLRAGDFYALGWLLMEQARLLCQLHPPIATPAMRRIGILAYQHRAIAAAVNSTGSYVTVLCHPEARDGLERDLQDAGYPVYPLRFDHDGLRVWTRDEEQHRAPLPARTRRAA